MGIRSMLELESRQHKVPIDGIVAPQMGVSEESMAKGRQKANQGQLRLVTNVQLHTLQ